MTIGILVPGADFSGAQFFVNRNPLPALPAGLDRLHLTRRSLAQMGRNLADVTQSAVLENLGGGSVTYGDTDVSTVLRGTGWDVDDYNITEADGATLMCVGVRAAVVSNYYLKTGPTSVTSDGIVLRTSGNTIRVDVRTSAGSGNAQAGGTNSYDADPFMMFGGVTDAGADAFAYNPAADVYAETEMSGTVGSIPGGVALCRNPVGPSEPDECKMFLWAAWSRSLSQAEMASVYITLKPWLANVGVEIL